MAQFSGALIAWPISKIPLRILPENDVFFLVGKVDPTGVGGVPIFAAEDVGEKAEEDREARKKKLHDSKPHRNMHSKEPLDKLEKWMKLTGIWDEQLHEDIMAVPEHSLHRRGASAATRRSQLRESARKRRRSRTSPP